MSDMCGMPQYVESQISKQKLSHLLGEPLSRRSSKGFLVLLYKLWILLIFAVYGIWEDLDAWKTVLRDMPMICLHFFGIFKNDPKSRSVNIFSAADFCSKQYKKNYLPAKASPRHPFNVMWTSASMVKKVQ